MSTRWPRWRFCDSLALLRLGLQQSTHGLALTRAELGLLSASVQAGREVVLLRRFVGPLTGDVEAKMIEVTDEEEWSADLQQELGWGRGDLVGWEQAVLDAGRSGSIDSVSPGPGDRRVHALVDAKRPSEEGTVPVSGPY